MISLTFRHSRQGLLAVVAAAALLLASVAPAFAADSTGGGYRDQGGQVQGQVQEGGVGAAEDDNTGTGTDGRGRDGQSGGDEGGNSPTTTSGRESGTLPFTGLQVGLILIAGVAFAGLGFGLRRVARDSTA